MYAALFRQRRRPSIAKAAVSDAAEGPGNEGNPALQENLVRMVRLQIGQEEVKESVEMERQKLQEIADEVIPAACHSAVEISLHTWLGNCSAL
jgi:hypothetical protein